MYHNGRIVYHIFFYEVGLQTGIIYLACIYLLDLGLNMEELSHLLLFLELEATQIHLFHEGEVEEAGTEAKNPKPLPHTPGQNREAGKGP